MSRSLTTFIERHASTAESTVSIVIGMDSTDPPFIEE
jgi:hypothetical protein